MKHFLLKAHAVQDQLPKVNSSSRYLIGLQGKDTLALTVHRTTDI